MANGTTSFWDYIIDTATYLSEQVSDVWDYVTSADTWDIKVEDIVGSDTSKGKWDKLQRSAGRGTGMGKRGGEYSGGFLDYTGDVYQAGKDVAKWSGKIITSDTFGETMAYLNKLRLKGAGTEIPKIPLPDTSGRGGYKSAPVSGFRPTQSGRGSNVPKSYGLMQPIKNNSSIMERINSEASGVYGDRYTTSSRNLSSKAQLGAISVSNPYTGTRISGAKHQIT